MLDFYVSLNSIRLSSPILLTTCILECSVLTMCSSCLFQLNSDKSASSLVPTLAVTASSRTFQASYLHRVKEAHAQKHMSITEAPTATEVAKLHLQVLIERRPLYDLPQRCNGF